MTLANARANMGFEAAAATTADFNVGKNISFKPSPFSVNFGVGTGANQVQVAYADEATLAGGAGTDLDLNGALTDIEGNSFTPVKVKMLYIENKSDSAGNLLVGGAASNQFAAMFGDATDILVLPPGAAVMLINPSAAGYAVAAGTADLLRLENADATNDTNYKIAVFGSGA